MFQMIFRAKQSWKLKTLVFWHVTPCHWVVIYWCIERQQFLQLGLLGPKMKIIKSFKIMEYTHQTTQDITFSNTTVTTSNLTVTEIFKVFHRSSMTMLCQYLKKSHILFHSCPPKFITHIQFSTMVKLGFHVFKFICSWILRFLPPPQLS